MQALIIAALAALSLWGVAFAAVAPLAKGGAAPGLFYDRVLKVENAGGGKTALITPGLGATYDKFILQFGAGSGLTAADLTEIRILANDVEIFKDTGANLDLRQAYLGADTDAGEVTIDFTEPRARGGASEQYLASLPANLLKKLQIEVDIADAEGVGEDFTAITCAAEFRGRTQNPYILKRKRFLANCVTGENDLFLPAGVSGGLIKRVWLHDGDHLTATELRVGGFIAMKYRSTAELERIQARQIPALVPQAGMVVLDFIPDGNLNGMLNTAAGQGQQAPDVNLKLTLDADFQVKGYIDYIDPINRLK